MSWFQKPASMVEKYLTLWHLRQAKVGGGGWRRSALLAWRGAVVWRSMRLLGGGEWGCWGGGDWGGVGGTGKRETKEGGGGIEIKRVGVFWLAAGEGRA